MRVLFSALHLGYFRNFESVIRALAERGHHVHLTADEADAVGGGQELAARLAAEYPGITWDLLPALAETEPWFDAAQRLRLGLDYARALERRFASTPKLKVRARERTPRVVRWAAAVPLVGPPLVRATLKRLERLMPRSAALTEYLRARAPDVVVLASLTYARSQQLDLLKAARGLGQPVAAAIMSWDHLSSKAPVHVTPDRVLVWNDVQRQEAVEMHGLAAERIVVTGAQCYDQWFGRGPGRSRAAFCRAMGLPAERPFVLWVHSALSPTPDPPEPVLVTRWLEALRGSADAHLRELAVLVRPHPERIKEWAGVDLSRFAAVAFHGRNPIDAEAKDDYFDALYYSRAVIGLVTSAFLEAAIVGRPVLTFTLPEYRLHQEEMAHFRYLTEVGGGLLHTAPDITTHLEQLARVVASGAGREERNRRFLTAFVRPGGLDTPATPVFVEALEALHRTGTIADPTLDQYLWLRPLVASGAAAGRTGLARWLLLDARGDVRDDYDEQRRRIVEARVEKKVQYQRARQRQRSLRMRRDALHRRGKVIAGSLRVLRYHTSVGIRRRARRLQDLLWRRSIKKTKSVGRRLRHRTAITVRRVLTLAGIGNAHPPGAGES
jgi:hypothetical protein